MDSVQCYLSSTVRYTFFLFRFFFSFFPRDAEMSNERLNLSIVIMKWRVGFVDWIWYFISVLYLHFHDISSTKSLTMTIRYKRYQERKKCASRINQSINYNVSIHFLRFECFFFFLLLFNCRVLTSWISLMKLLANNNNLLKRTILHFVYSIIKYSSNVVVFSYTCHVVNAQCIPQKKLVGFSDQRLSTDWT